MNPDSLFKNAPSGRRRATSVKAPGQGVAIDVHERRFNVRPKTFSVAADTFQPKSGQSIWCNLIPWFSRNTLYWPWERPLLKQKSPASVLVGCSCSSAIGNGPVKSPASSLSPFSELLSASPQARAALTKSRAALDPRSPST